MNKIKRLLKKLSNREENIRLTKWMLSVVKPYTRFIVYTFIISVLSMLISYVSTIVGKYVVDDATNGVINLHNMAWMCGATFVSIAISVFSSIISSYISEKFSFSLKKSFFNDIQRSVWLHISKIHSGDLVTRLTSDIGAISDGLISIIPQTVLIVTQLLIAFCILFYYDKKIALFALALGPIGALCLFIFRERYKRYQAALRKSESAYRSFMQETLSNLTIIKAFGQENYNDEKMENYKKERLKLVFKNSRLSSIMSAVMRIIYSVGYVVAFCWGSYRISTGDITYGTLTIFITLVAQVQGSISSLASIVPQYYSMLVSAKRIYTVIHFPKEVYTGKTDVPAAVGVEAKEVDFAYDKAPVLKEMNFTVTPGQKVAVVGPSGAGKTTLVRLLLALTEPNSGNLYYTLDGERIELATPDCRRFVSYVPQGNTLISGTVEENLKFGLRDASEEQMWHALELAAADKFVKKLPDGLKAELSEKSGGISEGQAQRISIARALIADKPVLILDEATSALDEATESVIVKNITEQLDNKTCFIITHRRSMLQYCDTVIEIDEDARVTMK
ncbi:MAG: ABC transporter ATP-binding protein [Ruminococcaceae bacterium]|nr:ABC transporter ATP-binding protein [Oscillospiraceae bacterium]